MKTRSVGSRRSVECGTAGGPSNCLSRVCESAAGHRDASIRLRVYAHWVPDVSTMKAVNLLDDAQPSGTQAQPTTKSAEWKNALRDLAGVVTQNFASWNQTIAFVRRIDELRRVA